MRILQTLALPLGYAAARTMKEAGRALSGNHFFFGHSIWRLIVLVRTFDADKIENHFAIAFFEIQKLNPKTRW